jgi:ABC-type branched-subunit amino acid transport system substrate-binding protein
MVRCKSFAVAAAILLAATGCHNAKVGGNSAAGGGADTQGITATQIKVGSLAAITGPLGNQYAPVSDGAQAYIDMINDQGGVAGRKINLSVKLDDGTNPSRDISQAQALNEQSKVFAVVGVATPTFSGGIYLGSHNVPTFGWNVNTEWTGPASLFGEKGSFLDLTSASPVPQPYLAKKLGVTKVGTLAYNVAQSQQCADQTLTSLQKFGFSLPFRDTSLPFGTSNIDADIERMKQSGVQMMGTCMDPSGNILLSRGIRQNDLRIAQYWPNGYDQDTIHRYADLMEGVYFAVEFTPFEAASTSPGMQQFLAQMHQRFPNDAISEVQLAGWISANMFVDGLKAVGPNLTRSKLIAAVNAMHNFTANGIRPAQAPLDWAYVHTQRAPTPDCNAFVQVQHGKFVPVFGTPTDPFVCIPHNTTTLPG